MSSSANRPHDGLGEQKTPCAEEPGVKSPGSEDIGRLLDELRTCQTELEVQNEELRLARQELNTLKSHYEDLFELAPVGYCTISEEGLILEANATMANLLGVAPEAMVKQPLSRMA